MQACCVEAQKDCEVGVELRRVSLEELLVNLGPKGCRSRSPAVYWDVVPKQWPPDLFRFSSTRDMGMYKSQPQKRVPQHLIGFLSYGWIRFQYRVL